MRHNAEKAAVSGEKKSAPIGCGVLLLTLFFFGCGPRSVIFALRPPRFRLGLQRLVRRPKRRDPQPAELALRRRVVEPADAFLRLAPEREAANTNAVDLLADTRWHKARLGVGPARDFYLAGERKGSQTTFVHTSALTPRQLARGAATTFGPSLLGPWRVVAAGSDPRGPWLIVADCHGHRFVLRFDPPQTAGWVTGAELMVTLLLHGAGYHVPPRHMLFFRPQKRLRPAAGGLFYRNLSPWRSGQAIVSQARRKKQPTLRASPWRLPYFVQPRALKAADLSRLLAGLRREKDGSLRALATRIRAGADLGPYPLIGRRTDDPNDWFAHQHRRDLRGLKLIAAWLDLGRLDELSTADRFLPDRTVLHTLRHLVPSWAARKTTAAAGWWPAAQKFHPRKWRPQTPHPAFERATDRDLFWAGRIVAAFSRKHIEAVVKAAYLSPQVTRQVSRRLYRRAQRAARYGLSRAAPLGFFRVKRVLDGPAKKHRKLRLCFTDLWRRAGFETQKTSGYRFSLSTGSQKKRSTAIHKSSAARTCLDLGLSVCTSPSPQTAKPDANREYVIVRLHRKQVPADPVHIHLRRKNRAGAWRVVGVRR
jgi:hypothetical protein